MAERGEYRLDFERLAVFQRALDLVEVVDRLGRAFRGARSGMRYQAFDAACSVALNIAESTGRHRPLDQARFLDIANGSAREVGAAIAIADRLGIGESADRLEARRLLQQVVAMLTTSARRTRSRHRPTPSTAAR